MRFLVALAGLVSLTFSAGAGAAAPVVLQPSGKWVVDFQDKMCVMSRSFGTGDDAVTVAFRPWPMSDVTQLVLIGWGHASSAGSIYDGSITIGSAPIDRGHHISWRDVSSGKTLTAINVKQDQLDKLSDGQAITVHSSGRMIAFAPVGLARAEKVAQSCEDGLAKSWGIDPDEKSTLAKPAKSLAGSSWISWSDYPSEAFNKNAIGDTTILYTVATDGKVSECRIVGSSGSPALDKAACDAIIRRGRFSPAIDVSGKPTVSHQSPRIDWRMGG